MLYCSRVIHERNDPVADCRMSGIASLGRNAQICETESGRCNIIKLSVISLLQFSLKRKNKQS